MLFTAFAQKIINKESIKRVAVLLLFALCFVIIFNAKTSAAIREEISFIGKVADDDGTNLTSSDASCLVAGASNDTCDFRFRIYDAVTAGTLLWEEVQSNIEIGSYDGTFQVNLGSVTSLNDVDLQNFSRNDLFVQVEFDPSGNADFAEGEIFSPRDSLAAVPTAFNSKYLDGISSSVFLGISPASAYLTGDVTTSLLWLNENGSGTPNLLELEVGGADRLVLSNSGNLTISVGDLFIASVGLNDVGTGPTNSGGSLIGIFDEFANSSSTTAQDVIDDLDAAITGGAIGDITSVTAGAGLSGGGLTGDITLDIGAGDGISVAGDSIAVDATVLRTTTNFGGDVSGVYSAIALGADSVSDSEIDYATVTLADFTNDTSFYTTATDSYLLNTSDTGDLTLTSTTTQDQYKFNLINNTSSGTQNVLVLNNSGSGTTETLLSLLNSGTVTNLISAANFIVAVSGDITTSGGDILGANSRNIDIGEANSGGVTITGDLYPNADNTYDIGSGALRWQDGYYSSTVNVGSTLTASDSYIRDTNGDINLQPDNDTDDYVYINATSNTSYVYWEGVLTYTNDPGLRVNSTSGEMEYRDQDSPTWMPLDNFVASGSIAANEGTIADGSYLELAHGQSSYDILTTGWVYDSGASEWRKVEDSVQGVGSHTTSDGNLEGWWKGEEASGTLNDETSNNNDLVNGQGGSGASYSNVGARANAIKLDGTNDYFSVADSSTLSPTSTVSVGAWIKLDDNFGAHSADSDYGVIDKGDYRLYLSSDSGKLTFEVNDSAATSWTTSYTGTQENIPSLAVYNGKLYAGQGSSATDGDVFVLDGTQWVKSFEGAEEFIGALTVYNGKLYAGQGLSLAGDGDVYVFDGVSWQLSYAGATVGIISLAVFNGKLYAGEVGAAGDGNIQVFDGNVWSLSFDGPAGALAIESIAEYNGKLYAGLRGAGAGDGDVYVCDPTTAGAVNDCDNASDWTLSFAGGSAGVFSLGVFGGKLYAGQNGTTATIFDGSSWGGTSFGTTPFDYAAYAGKFYAGKGLGAGLGDIEVCDPAGGGDSQTCDNASDFSTIHNGAEEIIDSIAVYNGKLYAGQGNGAAGDGDILVYGNNKVTSSVKNNWEGGRWYHVAATYDTSTDTANLYVNGTLDSVNSSTTVTTAIEDSTSRLFYGTNGGSTGVETPDGLFKGAIDEGFVYSDVLTASEIANLGKPYELYKIVQTDSDMVRLYNYSGVTQSLRLAAVSGAGSTQDVRLTNKSGGTVTEFTLVIADSSNDKAFTTTTTANHQKVIGVMTDPSCSNNAVCTVRISGKATVNANEVITRGEYLFTSTTAGEARGDAAVTAGAFGVALTGDALPGPYQVDVVIFTDPTTELFEDGTNGIFEDDEAVIVGGDVAFSYVGTPSAGDLRIADDFEAVGDGYVGGNLVAGASTSSTETIGSSGFVFNGDDLFVAGLFGVEANLYTDGDLTIQSDVDTTGAGDIALNFGGTNSEVLGWSASLDAFTLTDDFLPSTDAAFDLGSSGLRWKDGYFSGTVYEGSTLQLNEDFIRDSNGDLSLQSDNDTDDFIKLNTTTNISYLYWDGVLAYTNLPGTRVNGTTGRLEYRDEDESTWTAFDSSRGEVESTNGVVADGSYLELVHNLGTNNIISDGFVYDGTGEWMAVNDSVEASGTHTTSDSNLKAWWKGESYPDLNDETSNNNDLLNGQGSSGATYGVAGARGEGVKLDGTNDYFSVADSASLSPTSAVSVGAWIKLDENYKAFSADTDYGVVDKGDYRLYLEAQSGKLSFEVNDSAATSWTTSYNSANGFTHSLAVYNGKLYAGEGFAAGEGDVYVFDGVGWVKSFEGAQEQLLALLVFDGKLYAGQGSSITDGDVYVFDGVSWQLSYDGAQESIVSLVEYNGKLYAGQGSGAGDGDVLVFDGNTWVTSYNSTLSLAESMLSYGGYLYASQGGALGDGNLLICDPSVAGAVNDCDNASDWSTSYDGAQESILSLATYNGRLYMGQGTGATDGDIFVCNPATAGTLTKCDNASDWTTAYDSANEAVNTIVAYGGRLYAGGALGAGDGDVLVCVPTVAGDAQTCDNASDWSISFDGANTYIDSLATYNGKLYAGQGAGVGLGDIFVYGNNKVTKSVKNSWEGGKWYHVAATYDSSTDTSNLYVNGILDSVNSATMVTTAIEDGNTRLYYGDTAGTNGDRIVDGLFKGSIDEGFVYSDVLTSAEVAFLANKNDAYKIVQVDTNTTRIYNYSGASQTLRLTAASAIPKDISSPLTLDPDAADVSSIDGGNGIYVNRTGEGGNAVRLQNDGVDTFKVDSEGNLTIGNSALDDVDVNIYGDILQQAGIDQTSINTNLRSVFVYDTTKDSDKGAWTDSETSRQLSWYSETKDDTETGVCSATTADRCGRSAFPKKALIVGSDSGVYIFDAQNSKLWMKFSQDENYSLGIGRETGTVNNAAPVFALNGVIYVGTINVNPSGLFALDLKQDKMFKYHSTGRFDSGTSRISDRNSAITYGNVNTAITLSSNSIHSIDGKVINGRTMIAIAAVLRVNVIDVSRGEVFTYSHAAADKSFVKVALSSQGNLYAVDVTDHQLDKWRNVQNDTAIRTAADKAWDETTTPALLSTASGFSGNGSLYVEEAGQINETIYVGTISGMTRISDVQGDESNGSVKYYNTSYITEEMVGDIRGMWPMNGTIGAIADNANITDASLKVNVLDADNATGTGFAYVSGVRGTGVTLDGVNDFACSDANNDNACDADTDYEFGVDSFSIATWFKHSTSITAEDDLIDYTFNTTPAGVDGFRVYMNGSGVINFGIDAGAGFTPDDNVVTTGLYNDNEWHHLVAVKEGITAIRLYIDGVLVGEKVGLVSTTSITDGGAQILGVGANCSVGAACATGASFWDGSIDELMLVAEGLTPDQIKGIYASGRGALKYNIITVTDATSATSTTIVDSSETWTPNEFVGAFVEITGGTGAGQARRIIQNTATTMTISPAWTVTPSTDSDFTVDSEQLFGSINSVIGKSIVTDDKGNLYVGTDGGGVTKFGKNTDTVLDVWNSNAGKQDDSGVLWNNAALYDFIQQVSYSGDLLAIGSYNQMWVENSGKGFTEKFDDLANEVNTLQTSLPGVLTDTHRQDDTTNSTVGYQVVKKGWGFLVGDATTKIEETVTFGITFDDTPIVVMTEMGYKATTDPLNLQECITEHTVSVVVNVSDITLTTFLANQVVEVGNTLAAANRNCYTWLAIGTYTGGSVANAYGSYTGGADLAENYRTYDMEVEEGSVVGIDSERDIAVERTSKAYDSGQIGIIATKPGIVLGPEDGSTPGTSGESTACDSTSTNCKVVEVALAGRVPVKVSLENGSIKRGDFLTASSTPGVAMKATKAGPVIGRALENFDGSQSVVGYISDDILREPQDDTLSEFTGDRDNYSELGSKSTTVGKVMAFVETGYYWGDSGAEVNLASLDTTYDEAVIAEDNSSSESQDSVVTTPISAVKNLVEGLTVSSEGGEVMGVSVDKLVYPKEGEVAGTYTLGGLIFKEEDSSLSSIGVPLNLQTISNTDIDIFNGKIILSSDGSIKLNGTLEAQVVKSAKTVTDVLSADKLEIGSQAQGEAKIVSGERNVRISSELVTTDSKIILSSQTATTLTLAVTEKGNGYFVVSVPETWNNDISFNYWVIGTDTQ